MKVSDFIRHLAFSLRDPNFKILKESEWKDLISFEVLDLLPEIKVKKVTEVSMNDEYQCDLSDFSNIEDVKDVLLEDSDGKIVTYNFWVYNPEKKLLDLKPESYVSSVKTGLEPVDYDPACFEKIYVVWTKLQDKIEGTKEELEIPRKYLSLLKKMCQKAALERILMDRLKLPRYQTMLGSSSNIEIARTIKQLETEIFYQKSKLQDQGEIRTF